MDHAHEVAANHGNGNHGKPAGHLGESPEDVGNGDLDAELNQETVEGVENTLIGRSLLVLLLGVKLGNVQSSGVDAVERDKAHSGSRRRLVGERSRDLDVDN